MSSNFLVLYESASGFSLFSITESDEIGALLEEVKMKFSNMRRSE